MNLVCLTIDKNQKSISVPDNQFPENLILVFGKKKDKSAFLNKLASKIMLQNVLSLITWNLKPLIK